MRTGPTSPGGYLRSVIPDALKPSEHAYRTNVPGQIPALGHTERLETKRACVPGEFSPTDTDRNSTPDTSPAVSLRASIPNA